MTADDRQRNMTSHTRSRPPVGQQVPTPARLRKAVAPRPAVSVTPNATADADHYTALAPDPAMQQARRDIEAGQVDTDMHATPGLDAALRASLVPGPGGQPPSGQR